MKKKGFLLLLMMFSQAFADKSNYKHQNYNYQQAQEEKQLNHDGCLNIRHKECGSNKFNNPSVPGSEDAGCQGNCRSLASDTCSN